MHNYLPANYTLTDHQINNYVKPIETTSYTHSNLHDHNKLKIERNNKQELRIKMIWIEFVDKLEVK